MLNKEFKNTIKVNVLLIFLFFMFGGLKSLIVVVPLSVISMLLYAIYLNSEDKLIVK